MPHDVAIFWWWLHNGVDIAVYSDTVLLQYNIALSQDNLNALVNCTLLIVCVCLRDDTFKQINWKSCEHQSQLCFTVSTITCQMSVETM